jgi:hypothetical protein
VASGGSALVVLVLSAAGGDCLSQAVNEIAEIAAAISSRFMVFLARTMSRFVLESCSKVYLAWGHSPCASSKILLKIVQPTDFFTTYV